MVGREKNFSLPLSARLIPAHAVVSQTLLSRCSLGSSPLYHVIVSYPSLAAVCDKLCLHVRQLRLRRV